MNLKDLLNADHEALLQWVVNGWRWWIGELMDLVPQKWRERFLQRKVTVAELTDQHILYRDDKTSAVLAEKPRGAIKVLLPPDQVLTREMDLPVLPVSDMKRMLALDLDRLTPFRADQVLFDAEIVSRDADAGRQHVVLGVITRDGAVAAMERARAFGLEPAGLGVVGNGIRSNLDFLPALRDITGGNAARKRAVYWWAAAGVLLAFNLFFFSWRDSNEVEQLRSAVEAQQTAVNVAMHLRDKVEKEAAHRVELMRQKEQASPLKVLDAVTMALPQGTWAEHFEWNGKSVQIRGFEKNTPDLLARLEASPLLHNARSLTPNPGAVNQASASFDLAADRRAETTR
ncbi:MAG TPA: PilN domain-containing protein [Rhizomicrobium sp.]